MARRVFRGVAVCVVAATLIAGCANAPDTATVTPGAAPGLTSTQVDVGALATLSGPISADFAPIVAGVRAYFSWVNSRGGVDGRQVLLTHAADDQGSPSTNAVEARALVEQDHVFAVVGVATAFFTGASFLARTGTPTFGYATQNEWAGPPNLFAAYGSVVDFATLGPSVAYVAHRTGARSVALMAYGVAQSAGVCAAVQPTLARLGIHVGYEDLSVPYGGDVSSDVLRMKAAHVDFVLSCMDVTGNIELSRTMQQNGMTDVNQLWLDGYDQSTLQANASLMRHTYFLVQHVPFEAAAAFPGAFGGLEQYLAVMHRYAPNEERSEVAMEGWLSAALFVDGLRAAGPHPTQQRVVAAINRMRSFTGDGLTTPVDWSIAHTTVTPPSCEASVVTATGPKGRPEFKLVFNRGHQIWVCFPNSGPIDLDRPVPPPAGSPGA
jgi:ABC-type branched-subunit amino acid transport system substrate-binding protein